MALTDEELFDFDRKRLDGYQERWVNEVLETMPDLYRNHLTVAKWIDHWRDGLEDATNSPSAKGYEAHYEGMVDALREIAAHLRQADLVPGGILYEDTVQKRV
jgi:hypothetical protein